MAFITPLITPVDTRCWRLSIPRDRDIQGVILGHLLQLTHDYNWEQTTGISVAETVSLMQEMFDDFSVGSFCMIGSLIHFVTNSPPVGVLLCDGTQYLRVDYPDLYADLPISLIIDADNFVVPTIQDTFMLASGLTYLPEDTGGSETHILIEAEMPSHIHQSPYPNIAIDIKSVGAPNIESASNPPVYLPSQATGGDQAHENMPPFIAYKVGIVAR